MASIRRRARVAALQALYELDCTGHDAERVLAYIREEQKLPEEACKFSRELVQGVLAKRAELDSLIEKFAPAFPPEQISVIDRNILRLAIFEILFSGETPVKVAINEAVELAKTFGSASSPRFVNGVLGSIVDHTDIPA